MLLTATPPHINHNPTVTMMARSLGSVPRTTSSTSTMLQKSTSTKATAADLATHLPDSRSSRPSLGDLEQVPSAQRDLDAALTSKEVQGSGIALRRKLSRFGKKPQRDYHSLAQATLSNPELHLSSDPLLDSDSPEHRRAVLASTQPQKMRGVLSRQKWRAFTTSLGASPVPAMQYMHTPPRKGVCQVITQSADAASSSYNSSGQCTSDLTSLGGSVVSSHKDSHDHTVAPRLSPLLINHARTMTISGVNSHCGGDLPERSPSTAGTQLPCMTKSKSATDWLRSKKWRAATVSRTSTSATTMPMQSTDPLLRSPESPLHPPSAAPDGSGSSTGSCEASMVRQWSGDALIDYGHPLARSTSRSSLQKGSCGPLPISDGSETPIEERLTLRMRAARAYLYEELSKLSKDQIELDQEQVTQLRPIVSPVSQKGSANLQPATSQELLTFWRSISSGVLLCLLANHLRPGVIQYIDRRDVEWVRADNLSRFLRAARDFFRVRSKDLFHPLDLADATVEGLDRAVRTILVVRNTAKEMGVSVRSPSSPITSTTVDRFKSKRRSLIPPSSPSGYFSLVAPTVDGHLSFNSVSSVEILPTSNGAAPSDMTIEEHRRAAQAKLTQTTPPPPPPPPPTTTTTTTGPKIWRSNSVQGSRSSESPGSKPPILLHEPRSPANASITFARDSWSPRTSSEEDLRSGSLYRDRRMSESAVSLKGVVEEDFEDLAQTVANPLIRQGVHDPKVGNVEPLITDVRSTPLAGTEFPTTAESLLSFVPISRNNSQKRIGREIAFAQHGQSNEWRPTPTASPALEAARPKISRGYSGRTTSPLPSIQAPILSHQDTSTLGVSVPFPRSSSTPECSLTGCATAPLVEMSTAVENGIVPAVILEQNTGDRKPSRPMRPAYRHLRYTSELQLPVAQWGLSHSHDQAPLPSLNRRLVLPDSLEKRRPDTEASSTTAFSAVGSKVESEGKPCTRSDSAVAASRHKLTLVEEDGKTKTMFQVGNCIGKGQFGSVYRALNLTTGQMVAVKRIKIEGRSEDEVTQLMHEVDLLKSLNHPSIVKYEGLVRGADAISIILEYVENGSLLHTLKAFGHLPEQLVASYVIKILEGLAYLHDMKVVHCDLKAANILTTKNGNVKLSDFGVSLNLQAMEKVQYNDAIGTPNWMAPEVIELRGASTAADIWSLGCTIIELLTGKPPYGDMLAMSAMFRIVEDERPPIPESCSKELQHFLLQCFDKDPLKRPQAADLFGHPWLLQSWSVYKGIRPQDSLPFLKRISSDAAVARRLDILTLQAAVDESEESVTVPFDVPSRAVARPAYRNSRSSSVPAGEAWTSAKSAVLASTRPSSPAVYIRAGTASSHQAAEIEQPASLPAAVHLSSIPVTFDRQVQREGEESSEPPGRTHRFVKSTFSRNIRCKLCLQSVRKHAVFCEQCGLMCHARCARDSTSACDVRAQLMLFDRQDQREQKDRSPPNEGEGQALFSNIHASAMASSAQASSDVQSTTSTGLFSAGLKYAMARSRRLSKGQSPESLPTVHSPSVSDLLSVPDTNGGIEVDSPTLLPDKHGPQKLPVRVEGTSSLEAEEAKVSARLIIGNSLQRSSHGSDTKHTQSSQTALFGEPRRDSATHSNLTRPADANEFRRGVTSSMPAQRSELCDLEVDNPKPAASGKQQVIASSSIPSIVQEQQRPRPAVTRSRPTHRVSHSTSDLLSLQALKVAGQVASSPPTPGLNATPSSHTDRTTVGPLFESTWKAQQQQQQQPASSTNAPTILGDKWKRRRTSSAAAKLKKEECAIM